METAAASADENGPGGSSPSKSKRIHALDALRGVAALSIILGHFYTALSLETQHRMIWVIYTPSFRFAVAAVIVFYLISGFVLALPYFGPVPPTYRQYAVKRLCRLYIPFAVVISGVFILYALTHTDRLIVSGMAGHFEELPPTGPFTLPMLARALLMTGRWEDNLPDPPMWSLVYELRISLLFPLLIVLCRRPWAGILVMAACYALIPLTQNSIGSYISFPSFTNDFFTTFLATLYFMPCFIMGILMARFREPLTRFLSDMSGGRRAILWVLVALDFCFLPDYEVPQPFTEIGGCGLILLLLSSRKLEKITRAGVLQWLGRISYSLYLIHLPIIFVLRHLFEDRLSVAEIYGLTLVIILPLATLTQRVLERPTIALGKMLARTGA